MIARLRLPVPIMGKKEKKKMEIQKIALNKYWTFWKFIALR